MKNLRQHAIRKQRSLLFTFVTSMFAALLSVNSSVAQNRRQMMVVDDGSGPTFLQFTMPNYQELKTPDFVRSDLPTINNTLKLEAPQRLSVQNLLEVYLRQFNSLLDEAVPVAQRTEGKRIVRRGPGGGGVGDVIRETFGGDDGLTGIDIDIAGPGRVSVAIEVGGGDGGGGGTLEDGEIVESSGGDDSADGAGGPGVTVSINTADGAALSEEAKQKLQTQAKELADKLQARFEAEALEGRGPLAGDSDPYADLDQRRQQYDELNAKLEKFKAARARLREQFVGLVQGQLSDPQIDRWPALERTLTRQKTLPKGQFDGERTNLLTVLKSMDLEERELQDLAEVLESYEISLHNALVQRNNVVDDLDHQVDEAVQRQDADKALRLIDRGIARRVAVRDVNEQFTAAIAGQLGDKPADAFREAALKASFPRIYGKTTAHKAFMQIDKLSGLDDETRSIIADFRETYSAELGTINEKIRRVTRKHQPQQPRQMLVQLKAAMESGVVRGGEFGSQDDPIVEAFNDRAALDERYMKRVYALLTPQQVQTLPKFPSTEGGSFTTEQGSRDSR